MQETVYFEAGSAIDKADRDLRHAAHVYHVASADRKQVARQALRRAAITFAAAAQELLPKAGR